MKGRYGPYVTDGKLNATIAKDHDPESVTMDEAVALLAARAAKGETKRPTRRSRKTVAPAEAAVAATSAKRAPKKTAAAGKPKRARKPAKRKPIPTDIESE